MHNDVINDSDIAERIESFVRTVFDVSPTDTTFNRQIDLYDLGYVDSVGFAELIEFLQEEFSVTIPDAELLSDEFLSVDGMAGIICRLASGG